MSSNVLMSFNHILKIHDLGFHSVDKIYTHPNRRLTWDVFLYVSEGQMEVWEENVEYVLKKGQFLFLKSGLHHWGEPKTPLGTSWYWIHFTCDFHVENCKEFNYSLNTQQTLSLSDDDYNKFIMLPKQGIFTNYSRLENKLDSLLELFNSNNPFRAILLSQQTVDLFLSFIRESVENLTISKSDYTAQRIIKYLEHKNSYMLNSKELENNLEMNYCYLCEVFKEKTGSTIHHYNAQLFIGKAIDIMKKSNMNISEISDTLGFKNPFYFSRVFKRIVGCTPTEYRNGIYRNIP